MKKIAQFTCFIALAALFASCDSETWRRVNYFQDIQSDTTLVAPNNLGVIIQPLDQLSIIVSHRTHDLAALYNLPIVSYQAGSEIATSNTSQQRLIGYVVNNNGDIQFPELGTLHVAGLTRWQLQEMVAKLLAESGKLDNAIVTVEFMNFKISVLGEVNNPGTYSITGDKININQALAMARDLTIYGQRENVKVLREREGGTETYVLDLTDLQSLQKSPAYYLQQNDVIYVTPSAVRAGQSTLNENYFKSGAFWVSLSSVVLSTTSLAVNILYKKK